MQARLNGSRALGWAYRGRKRPALDVNCDRNNQEKETKENLKELRGNKMHQGIVQHSCKPSNEEKNDDVQLDEAATGSATATATAREG